MAVGVHGARLQHASPQVVDRRGRGVGARPLAFHATAGHTGFYGSASRTVQLQAIRAVVEWLDVDGVNGMAVNADGVQAEAGGQSAILQNLIIHGLIASHNGIYTSVNGIVIRNCIIGPHVAIGSNTSVQYSIVRDSIIGSYTSLYEVVLDNSLIGSDASVKGLSRSLNIGDNTEIDFG